MLFIWILTRNLDVSLCHQWLFLAMHQFHSSDDDDSICLMGVLCILCSLNTSLRSHAINTDLFTFIERVCTCIRLLMLLFDATQYKKQIAVKLRLTSTTWAYLHTFSHFITIQWCCHSLSEWENSNVQFIARSFQRNQQLCRPNILATTMAASNAFHFFLGQLCVSRCRLHRANPKHTNTRFTMVPSGVCVCVCVNEPTLSKPLICN